MLSRLKTDNSNVIIKSDRFRSLFMVMHNQGVNCSWYKTIFKISLAKVSGKQWNSPKNNLRKACPEPVEGLLH